MHEGLVRFYPTLGSKGLAEAILQSERSEPNPQPSNRSDRHRRRTHLRLHPALLHPRSPSIWSTAASTAPGTAASGPTRPPSSKPTLLDRLWAGPRRIFLLTYHPDVRTPRPRPLRPRPHPRLRRRQIHPHQSIRLYRRENTIHRHCLPFRSLPVIPASASNDAYRSITDRSGFGKAHHPRLRPNLVRADSCCKFITRQTEPPLQLLRNPICLSR